MDQPQEQLPHRLPENNSPLSGRDEIREAVRQALTHDPELTLEHLYQDYTSFITNSNAPYVNDLPSDAISLPLGKRFTLRMGCTHDNGQGSYGKGHFVLMHLYDNTQPPDTEPVAAFNFHERSPGHFELSHRLVDQDYRETGIGNWILSLIGGFAQTAADQRGLEQTLEATAGQYGLMNFLLKHEFEPNDPARMQSIHDGMKNATFLEWSPRPDGMPYLYKKETPLEERKGLNTSPKYGVRIHLKKSFMPRQKSEG